MEFNFFLWPMLIPMIIPFFYCLKYKKDACSDIGIITIAMILIVLLYWPLLTSNLASTYTYLFVKVFLFVIFPIFLIAVIKYDISAIHGISYGVTERGLVKSFFWFILLLPIMLVVTGLIQNYHGVAYSVNFVNGVISFFEAGTEEFFFRGILFIFLLKKTNIQIAYVTSLMSFILIHPQNISNIFIIGTIIQGILVLEIARRSHNIIGSWMLHGSNRFFELVIIPLFI